MHIFSNEGIMLVRTEGTGFFNIKATVTNSITAHVTVAIGTLWEPNAVHGVTAGAESSSCA